MGIYINPHTDTSAFSKRDTIAGLATMVDRSTFVNHNPGDSDTWGVAVVDNGGFYAAAVAYSPDEARVFAREEHRPIEYFLMRNEKIREVDPRTADELDKLKRG